MSVERVGNPPRGRYSPSDAAVELIFRAVRHNVSEAHDRLLANEAAFRMGEHQLRDLGQELKELCHVIDAVLYSNGADDGWTVRVKLAELSYLPSGTREYRPELWGPVDE